MPGSEISHAPENNSFAAYFVHLLKLRRECRDGGGGWELARRDLLTGRATRARALLRVVPAHFQGADLDAQKQWTGLAEGQEKCLTEKSRTWGVTAHHDLPSSDLMIA